jgi:hypothetical protein
MPPVEWTLKTGVVSKAHNRYARAANRAEILGGAVITDSRGVGDICTVRHSFNKQRAKLK